MTSYLSKRYNRTDRAVAWILLIIGFAVAIAGWMLGWGKQYIWFDEFLHLFNSFSVTLVLAIMLYGAVLVGDGRHRTTLVLTVMLVGVGLGGIWEILEWIYDYFFVEQANVIKGKTDTITDLILDTVGALAAGLLALRMARE